MAYNDFTLEVLIGQFDLEVREQLIAAARGARDLESCSDGKSPG